MKMHHEARWSQRGYHRLYPGIAMYARSERLDTSTELFKLCVRGDILHDDVFSIHARLCPRSEEFFNDLYAFLHHFVRVLGLGMLAYHKVLQLIRLTLRQLDCACHEAFYKPKRKRTLTTFSGKFASLATWIPKLWSETPDSPSQHICGCSNWWTKRAPG